MFSFSIDEEIKLQLLEEHHAEALFELTDRNREHLSPWLGWVEDTTSIDDTLAFIRGARKGYADNNHIPTGVWYGGKLCGTLGIIDINTDVGSGEIGYWLSSDVEGNGIMTRACRALISYVFSELQFNRIVIRFEPGNTRSGAIPKRLGFTKEGTLRECARRRGDFVDLEVWSVLNREWTAQQ